MISYNFAFAIGEAVRVKLFGLNYDGRVERCIAEEGRPLYGVMYAQDGDIKRETFLEDELEAVR